MQASIKILIDGTQAQQAARRLDAILDRLAARAEAVQRTMRQVGRIGPGGAASLGSIAPAGSVTAVRDLSNAVAGLDRRLSGLDAGRVSSGLRRLAADATVATAAMTLLGERTTEAFLGVTAQARTMGAAVSDAADRARRAAVRPVAPPTRMAVQRASEIAEAGIAQQTARATQAPVQQPISRPAWVRPAVQPSPTLGQDVRGRLIDWQQEREQVTPRARARMSPEPMGPMPSRVPVQAPALRAPADLMPVQVQTTASRPIAPVAATPARGASVIPMTTGARTGGPTIPQIPQQTLTRMQALQAITDKTKQSFAGLTGSIGLAAAGIAAFAAVRGVQNISRTVMSLEKLRGLLFEIGRTSASTEKEWSRLNSEADRLGVEVITLGTGFAKTMLAAKSSGAELDKVREMFYATAQATTKFGMSTEETEGLFLALTQVMAKGKLTAEELTGQIAERLPVAFGELVKASGKTSEQFLKDMEAGKIGVSSFVDLWSAAMKNIAPGTGRVETAAASFGRFGNAVTRAKGAMGDSGFLREAASAAEDLAKALASPEGQLVLREMGAGLRRAVEVFADALRLAADNMDTLKTAAEGAAYAVAGIVAIKVAAWALGAVASVMELVGAFRALAGAQALAGGGAAVGGAGAVAGGAAAGGGLMAGAKALGKRALSGAATMGRRALIGGSVGLGAGLLYDLLDPTTLNDTSGTPPVIPPLDRDRSEIQLADRAWQDYQNAINSGMNAQSDDLYRLREGVIAYAGEVDRVMAEKEAELRNAMAEIAKFGGKPGEAIAKSLEAGGPLTVTPLEVTEGALPDAVAEFNKLVPIAGALEKARSENTGRLETLQAEKSQVDQEQSLKIGINKAPPPSPSPPADEPKKGRDTASFFRERRDEMLAEAEALKRINAAYSEGVPAVEAMTRAQERVKFQNRLKFEFDRKQVDELMGIYDQIQQAGLDLSVNQEIQGIAEQVKQLDLLTKAYGETGESIRQTEAATAALQAAQALGVSGDDQQVERLTDAFRTRQDAERTNQVAGQTRGLELDADQSKGMLAALELEGEARARAMAGLQAEIDLRRQGVEAASAQGQAYIEAAQAAASLQGEVGLKELSQGRELELRALQEEAQAISLVGVERAREMAAIQARLQLAQMNVDATSQEAQAYIALQQEIAAVSYQRNQAQNGLIAFGQAAMDLNANLQGAAISGLNSLENALVDVLMGTKSVKEAFRDMAASIAQDLMRVAIRQAIIGPLAMGMGMAFSGGGTMSGRAFAHGGTMMPDRATLSGSRGRTGAGIPVRFRAYASGGMEIPGFGRVPEVSPGIGGITRQPKVALFGEGSSAAEAYVPMGTDERIPLRTGPGGELVVSLPGGRSIPTKLEGPKPDSPQTMSALLQGRAMAVGGPSGAAPAHPGAVPLRPFAQGGVAGKTGRDGRVRLPIMTFAQGGTTHLPQPTLPAVASTPVPAPDPAQASVSQSVNFAPVVNVQAPPGGGSPQQAQEFGQAISRQIENQFNLLLQKQMRNGGLLNPTGY